MVGVTVCITVFSCSPLFLAYFFFPLYFISSFHCTGKLMVVVVVCVGSGCMFLLIKHLLSLFFSFFSSNSFHLFTLTGLVTVCPICVSSVWWGMSVCAECTVNLMGCVSVCWMYGQFGGVCICIFLLINYIIFFFSFIVFPSPFFSVFTLMGYVSICSMYGQLDGDVDSCSC